MAVGVAVPPPYLSYSGPRGPMPTGEPRLVPLLRRHRDLGIFSACRANLCSEHGPAHFHAIRGQYEADVEIETGAILAGSLPPRVSAFVREWCESYRAELIANWERARRHEMLEEMTKDILRILRATAVADHLLTLEFSDGVRKTVDVTPLLTGPVFKPLKDPQYFGRVVIDPICGTVVWPNGADFAPEALHDLAAVESVA